MKKFYVSFGQAHAHAINGITYDKDCLAEIHAETLKEARDTAFEIFKGVFHRVYEELPDMSFFPRGAIKV